MLAACTYAEVRCLRMASSTARCCALGGERVLPARRLRRPTWLVTRLVVDNAVYDDDKKDVWDVVHMGASVSHRRRHRCCH